MAEREGGIFVTSKTVSAILGVIALITVTFSSISTVNSYAYKVDSLETKYVQVLSSMDLLNKKLDKYNEKLDTSNEKTVSLTISITRLEERLKSMEKSK